MLARNREKIQIVCASPGCPRKKWVRREKTDPPLAVALSVLCPWHADGEFEDVTFYDKNGNEILQIGEKEYVVVALAGRKENGKKGKNP